MNKKNSKTPVSTTHALALIWPTSETVLPSPYLCTITERRSFQHPQHEPSLRPKQINKNKNKNKNKNNNKNKSKQANVKKGMAIHMYK